MAEESADLAAWRIERGERGIMRRAPPEDIHAAAIKRVAFVLLILRVGAVPNAGRLIRLHTRTADLIVEQAGHGERVVADKFGVKPHPRTTRSTP